MLEGKHANIGNTVGMVKEIHKLSNDPKLAEEITELFMAESDDCDYQKKGPFIGRKCSFPRILSSEGNKVGLPDCMVGNCPLGNIADEEMNHIMFEEFGSAPVIDFGDRHQMSPEWHQTVGGHIHIGYTGWRKYWDIFKKNLLHGWVDWLKTWPPYLREHWQLNLFLVALVLAVYYGAKLAGNLVGAGFY